MKCHQPNEVCGFRVDGECSGQVDYSIYPEPENKTPLEIEFSAVNIIRGMPRCIADILRQTPRQKPPEIEMANRIAEIMLWRIIQTFYLGSFPNIG